MGAPPAGEASSQPPCPQQGPGAAPAGLRSVGPDLCLQPPRRALISRLSRSFLAQECPHPALSPRPGASREGEAPSSCRPGDRQVPAPPTWDPGPPVVSQGTQGTPSPHMARGTLSGRGRSRRPRAAISSGLVLLTRNHRLGPLVPGSLAQGPAWTLLAGEVRRRPLPAGQPPAPSARHIKVGVPALQLPLPAGGSQPRFRCQSRGHRGEVWWGSRGSGRPQLPAAGTPGVPRGLQGSSLRLHLHVASPSYLCLLPVSQGCCHPVWGCPDPRCPRPSLSYIGKTKSWAQALGTRLGPRSACHALPSSAWLCLL